MSQSGDISMETCRLSQRIEKLGGKVHTDTSSYVKSCIQRRVRQLKSRMVTRHAGFINGKLGARHGVIC